MLFRSMHALQLLPRASISRTPRCVHERTYTQPSKCRSPHSHKSRSSSQPKAINDNHTNNLNPTIACFHTPQPNNHPPNAPNYTSHTPQTLFRILSHAPNRPHCPNKPTGAGADRNGYV